MRFWPNAKDRIPFDKVVEVAGQNLKNIVGAFLPNITNHLDNQKIVVQLQKIRDHGLDGLNPSSNILIFWGDHPHSVTAIDAMREMDGHHQVMVRVLVTQVATYEKARPGSEALSRYMSGLRVVVSVSTFYQLQPDCSRLDSASQSDWVACDFSRLPIARWPLDFLTLTLKQGQLMCDQQHPQKRISVNSLLIENSVHPIFPLTLILTMI